MARVCILRQGHFPEDSRLRREVAALCDAGHEVDVICQPIEGQPRREQLGPVTVHRLPVRHERTGPGAYALRYVSFMSGAGLLLTALHARRRYDLVQVNTVPDTLVFSAAMLRLAGVPVLLDLHECMPELFATKFGTGLDQPTVKLVARLERASIRFATYALTCNERMRETFAARGSRPEKIAVVHNSANEALFVPDRWPRRPRDPDRFVLVSHGTVEDYYGLDTVLRAIALLRGAIPGLRLEVYGDGTYLEELRRVAAELDLGESVFFNGTFLPAEEMPAILARADAGVVAVKASPHGNLMQTNKLFEFISMRTPVVASRTPTTERYFDESCLELFTPGDEADLARAIWRLYADAHRADRLAERALAASAPYRWSRQREVYMQVVSDLLERRARRGRRRRVGRSRAPAEGVQRPGVGGVHGMLTRFVALGDDESR